MTEQSVKSLELQNFAEGTLFARPSRWKRDERSRFFSRKIRVPLQKVVPRRSFGIQSKITNPLFFTLLALVAFIPRAALAAWTPGQPLVPCGTRDGVDCAFPHLITLIGNLIDLGIYIAVIGSALLFAYAGFLYITAAGNQGQVSKAHKIFLNVAIGLIIALAAWLAVKLIVNTLAPGFVNLG